MIFAPDDWEDFYAKRGWKTVDFRDTSQHAVKCGRVPSPSTLPVKMKHTVHAILQKLQGTVLRGSGVALLQKI